jgi:hypothetical protein
MLTHPQGDLTGDNSLGFFGKDPSRVKKMPNQGNLGTSEKGHIYTTARHDPNSATDCMM